MNKFKIRLATKEDIEAINTICEQAKARLKEMGLSQWQSGYPDKNDWLDGIKEQAVRVVINKNRDVIAAFCLSSKHEEMYDKIENGQWLTSIDEDNYLVLHRVCVREDYLRKHISTRIFDYAKEFGQKEHKKSIRIDTHVGNIPMKSTLKYNNFIQCGKVYLTDGPEKGDLRIAYEYLLRNTDRLYGYILKLLELSE